MSALTPEEQQIARMIEENNERIYSRVNMILNQQFSNQEKVFTERLRVAIKELYQASSQKNPEEERKFWIRSFAAQIITHDTVDHTVKLSHDLWNALEDSFNEGNVVH